VSNSPYPFRLSWAEVDPARHPFDHAAAPAVVAGLGPAKRVPARPKGPAYNQGVILWSYREGQDWTDAMNRAIAAEYGRWAVGWRWAPNEGELGGGPIRSWCCPRDSITTPAETVARVAAALLEWRGWLERLAERFDGYRLDGTGDTQRVWATATADLVTMVVERTGAGDAWYGHCEQVLTWFLSFWGVPPDRARRRVGRAIGGRFDSWSTPGEDVITDVATDLAEKMR
jgi:hypothetical protein